MSDLISKAEANRLSKQGWPVGRYDPSKHCDNKCLRAGHCMGGHCPTDMWEITGPKDVWVECA